MITRRTAVKSSIFGLLAVSVPSVLYANGVFEYNGAPLVKISFEEKGGKIVSLIVNEPSLQLKAVRSNHI